MKNKKLNKLRDLATTNKGEHGHPYYTVKDNKPYMPFYFEWIGTSEAGRELWAMCHWGMQNGDMMRDPEMVLEYDPKTEQWFTVSYRNDYAGFYEESTSSDAEQGRELFLVDTWLPNLVNQGFLDYEERKLGKDEEG